MKSTKTLAKKVIAMMVMAIMVFQCGVGAVGVAAEEKTTTDYDMTTAITDISIMALIDEANDEWFEIPQAYSDSMPEIEKDAKIKVTILYDPSKLTTAFKAGDTISYQLPSGLTTINTQKGDVYDGPTAVGKYEISGNNIIITLTNETYLNNSDGKLKNGAVSFDGEFESSVWGDGGRQEIKFGDISLTVNFKKTESKKAEVNVKKDILNLADKKIQADTKYIDYKITVTTPADNTQDMQDVIVEDTFTAGSSYIANMEVIPDPSGEAGPSKGSFDPDNKVWTIGTMKPGETQTLVVRANLNANIFADGITVGNRTITNKATVKATDAKTMESSVSATANSGLNITKTNGNYTFDKEKGRAQLTYTVTVTAPATNKWAITNVSVYDYFSDNKAYVVKYDSVNAPTGTTYSTKVLNTGTKEKSLTWNIGTMEPGDKKVLTYTVDIDQTIFLGSGYSIARTLKNYAQLKVKGTTKKTVNSTEKFAKEWLTKAGKVEPDGRIKFTVKGNKGTLMLKGDLTFTDTLTGNWVFDGDVVGKKYSKGTDGKYSKEEETIRFSADGQKTWTKIVDGEYYYEFTYYARYIGDKIGAANLSNKAGVGIGVGDKQYTHYYTWEGVGGEYNSLEKAFVSQEGNIATWESKIMSDIPAGTFYTDYRNSDHEWTVTNEQVEKVVVKKGNQVLVPGTDADTADYSIEKTGDSSFKITFLKEIDNVSENSPVTITYDTTLTTNDLDPGESAKYVNKAIIETLNGDKDTADAECSFLQEQRMTKTAGTYNKEATEITWLITVNNTGSLNDEAILTDILPEGLKFVDAMIVDRGSKAADTVIAETNVDGNNVIMKLDGLKQSYDEKAYITIEVRTKIVDTELLLGNNIEKTYSNEAELDYEGSTTKDDAQQTITNTSLTKEGVYNQDTAPNVEYEIKVNPDGLDMLDEAETIRIEDTMSSNMMLRAETLRVVDNNGDEVQIIDLKIEKNVFSFDVPDDKALTITYKAYVSGEVGEEVDTENTVTYYGMVSIPGETIEKKIKIAKSRASIEGAVGFYITKKDAHDINRPLEGTEYTLYKLGSDETIISTADANGIVSFVGIDETSVYAFKETNAIDEYLIDDINKELTYVAFNKQAAEKAQVPEGVIVDVIQSGVALERFNEFNSKTSIVFSGIKTLSNANYTLTEDMYEFTIAGPNLKNGSQTVDSLTIGHDADGNIKFPEIQYELRELDGADSKTYEYTIKENKGSKKGIEYSSDIYNVKVTVTKNNNGTISAAVTEVKKNGNPIEERTFDFVNTYNAKDVTTTVAGLKNTENIDLNAGDYTFQLRETTADAATPYTATAENDANGYFSFQLPTYTLADHGKTFTYEVSEVKGDKPGMTYDNTVYTVTINITDQLDGELELDKTITVNGETVDDINFINRFDGSVELTKSNGKDGDEYKTLAGAGFKLYKDGKPYRDNLITDGDGKLFVENLPVGSYYFVETTPPAGYDIVTDGGGNPLKYEFKIGPNGGDEVVNEHIEIDNRQKLGTLALEKSDIDTKALIKGVEFVLYKNGELYKDGLFTDENGIVEVNNLPWAEYYFVEVSAPNGYIVDATPTETVPVNAAYVDGAVKTLHKTNKFEGSVELTKTNGKDGEAYEVLSGAVFDLYKDDVLYKSSLTTGKDGKISVNGLPEASYYFVETTPPAGYSIVTDEQGMPLKYEFKIGPNGGEAVVDEIIEIANEQKLGTLSLIKKDVDSAALIEGAEFELYKDGELYQAGLITDAEGKITVTDLPWGDYYFVETVPAPGYIYDSTPTETITVDAAYVDGEPVTVEKTNKQTELYITKTDISGENLVLGSFIEIFKKSRARGEVEADPIVSWLSDGTNHLIKGELNIGETYILKETKAPVGYGYISSYIEFYVNADGTIETTADYILDENGNEVFLVQDDIIDLKVSKVDFETEEILEGAVLAIYDKETGEEIERWTSDKEGHYDFGKSLHANKTYVLKELEAPEGYSKIEDVEFEVLNEGQIDIITKTKYVDYENGHMSVANCKEEVEEIAVDDAVDTGDHTPLGMGMILMTLAMIGMVSAALAPRRREE